MITINDIIPLLPKNHDIVGNTNLFVFEKVSSLEDAEINHLTWIKPTTEDKSSLLFQTKAKAVLCGNNVELPTELINEKCIIKVDNPKLLLIEIINRWFVIKYSPSVHPSAVIHKDASIHPSVFVGPGCVIGNCRIGAYTRLEANITIYDDTVIGSEIIIQAGAIIGSDGFGHARSEKNELKHFPHIGNVVIHDNVHIGSNACIDRGVLGSTVISYGSKLNSLVFVAHNCFIGRNNLINPSVLFNGSVKIGDNNFIGAGAVIRNKVSIGNNTVVGMGAVVIHDVRDGDTVVGNPANVLMNKSNRPLY